jgi:hypothetical protein
LSVSLAKQRPIWFSLELPVGSDGPASAVASTAGRGSAWFVDSVVVPDQMHVELARAHALRSHRGTGEVPRPDAAIALADHLASGEMPCRPMQFAARLATLIKLFFGCGAVCMSLQNRLRNQTVASRK